MATQFIVRSQDKQPFGLRTVIYPGIEIKRTKENDIAVFELTDSDLIVELVVKRKSSAPATTGKTGVPPKPCVSSVQPAAKAAAPAAAAPSVKATLPTPPAKKSQEWNKRFNELVEFKRKNGHTNVSPKEHPELAIWVAQHAMHFNSNQLSQLHTETKKVTNQKTKKQWANLGNPKTKYRPVTNPDHEWNDRYTELIQYKRQHGNCLVRKSTCTDYPKLMAWISQQRGAFNKGLLSQERIQKFNDIGFNWDAKESMWNFHYALLMMYKQQHGHVRVPQSHFVSQKEGPAINLGNWAQTQRQDFKLGKISPDRVAKLNEIGFVWGIRDNCGWMHRYRELIEYRDQNGHCNVPQQYKLNKALGPWVDKQRQKFKKGLMSEKYQDLLNNIGFEWVRAKTPNRDYSKPKRQTDQEQNIEGDHDEDEQSDDEEEEGGGEGEDAYHDPNELYHHDAIRHSYPNVHLPPFYHDTSGNQMYNRYWS